MSTLEFFPKRTFSIRRYTLTRDGAEIGEIDCGGMGKPAALTTGGETYRPVSDSVVRQKFHLDAGGARLADAAPAGMTLRSFTVHAGAKTYTLKGGSWFSRNFVLTENDAEVGRIGRMGLFTARCRAELPDDMPLPVQGFLIWLALITWRRQTAVINVAGSVAAGGG
jgi:hypothetical protein